MRHPLSDAAGSAMERLRTGLTYSGETQYGSCVQQAVCNVLEAQGLLGAAALIGISWGFGHRPGDVRLGAGDRWLPAVARLSGLDLVRLRPGGAAQAAAAEQEALNAGTPVVTLVDSFDIESPHRGVRHLMHAFIVVGWDDTGVTVLDPMNRPRPQELDPAAYLRTRGSTVADGFGMIVPRGAVERRYAAPQAVGDLHADLVTHRDADLAHLDTFIAAVESGEIAPDVADVAAERTYAQRLVAAAARTHPTLEPVAASLDSLARRWYFAHTIGIAETAPGVQRMAKILRDLREREIRVMDEFDRAVREAGIAAQRPATAAPPGIEGTLRSILREYTSIDTAPLAPGDDLWSAGMTSQESVRLMIGLEDGLGIEFPPSMLTRATFTSLATIEQAVSLLLADRSPSRDTGGEGVRV